MPRTAIIIVNYRTPWHLKQCLESVFKHSTDFHLVLVQNKPDKASQLVAADFTTRYPGYLTVIENQQNLGYVGGVNSAYLEAKKYERICFLNSDIIVTSGWLAELNKAFDEDETVVQVSPDCNHYYPENVLWRGGKYLLSKLPWGLADRFYMLRLYMSPPRHPEKSRGFKEYEHFFQYPGGFCNMVRSKYFQDLGYLLDPNIIHGYWDDNDLGMYMKQFGKVGVTNRAYVFHFLNVSLRKVVGGKGDLKRQLQQLNAFYVIDKWRDVIAAELRKLTLARRIEFARNTEEVPMMLEYFGLLAQDQNFESYVRSIPAREVGAMLLGNQVTAEG